MLGSGMSLNELVSQSLLIKGDNTISGNFYVNDSNNHTVFKVDNVQKTITNTYKVGIGMDYPESILHIKDTSVQNLINELEVATSQWVLLNQLVDKLRETDESDFVSMIENNTVGQSVDSYYAVYKINTETFLSTDIKCVYHFVYQNWNGKIMKEIVDV